MVDALGGLEEAIDAAAKLAKLPTPPPVERPRRRFSLIDLLRNELGLPVPSGLLRGHLPMFKTPLYLMD
jgi:ClpP class serine protease